MTAISNSLILEDRYIAYMAGLSKKPADFADKYKIYAAQHHPIYNRIASSVLGSIQSGLITTTGILTYPFINDSIRSSIFGSFTNVCVSCSNNVKSFTDLMIKIVKFVQTFDEMQSPSHKKLSYWDEIKISYGSWLTTGTKCYSDELTLLACRGLNYGASIKEILLENYLLIGIGSIGLAALLGSYKMHSYISKEQKAAKEVKQDLVNKFSKIATRLIALKANPQAQSCAKTILERRLEINTEIEKLNIPNLSWPEIEQITQPVFDAAEELSTERESRIGLRLT